MKDFEALLIDLLQDKKKRIYLIAGAILALLLIAAILAMLLGGSGRQYNKYYKAAEAAYLAGDYVSAEDNLQRAMELKSSERDYLLMADIYCAEGDTNRAIQILYLGYSHLGGSNIESRLDELKGSKGSATLMPQQQASVTIAGKTIDSAIPSLVLSGTRLSAEDLSAISSLSRMENLGVSDCGIKDISFLSGLSGLTFLQISDNSVSDLSPIAGMKSLKTLYIDNNPIADFTPLYGLSALRTLSMKGIEISRKQLSELRGALPNCSIYADEEPEEEENHTVTLGGRSFNSDVTELSLGGLGITDISALTACTKLEKLDLRDNQITDISPLVELPNLKWLSIWNNKVEDINPLLSLGGIEYLDADANRISDISVLEFLPQLKELWLNKNPLKSVQPLRRLTELTRLGLAGTDLEDDDLDCLMGMKELRELNIKDNKSLSAGKVEELEKALSKCDISHDDLYYAVALGEKEFRSDVVQISAESQDIRDLSGLERFTQLQALRLNGNQISDLSPLKELSKLKELALSGNSVSDLSPLAGMKQLQYLNLHGNAVADLTPLSGCSSLKELDLGGNAVKDLTPLAGLTGLTTLDISNNSVSDLTALHSLTGLKSLDLRGNPLKGEDVAALRRALPDCTIQYGASVRPASNTDLH